MTVRLKDTDAAGVIYFTSQLEFAHETFEAFLDDIGRPLGRLLTDADYLLPIVRCEADFRQAVRVGDRLSVTMSVGEIGEAALTLDYLLRRDDVEIGRCRIVHASVDRRTFASVPLPAEVRTHLQALS